MKKNKIIIAGDYAYYIYERTVIEALNRLGYNNLIEFSFAKYLNNVFGKVERHFVFIGICSLLMNLSLIIQVLKEKPRILFIWRGILIMPLTLRIIKRISIETKLVSYNNDDPFSEFYKRNIQNVSFKNRINQKRLWHLFVKSLPYYDSNFVYREKNIEDYKRAGAKDIQLFMPYYIPSQIPDIKTKKKYDLIFIGHWENDGREKYIDRLIESGISVRLFGTGWEGKLNNYKEEVYPIYEQEYYKAISEAKISLVFMSKRNCDEYTRRCFEIPACGTMMLSERTNALGDLYAEDKEIVFFDSVDDLVEKAKFYLKEERYLLVGENGRIRAKESGYDIDSRVQGLMKNILE